MDADRTWHDDTDPHMALCRSEHHRPRAARCCECRRPWDGYATFDDGDKLCQRCAETDKGDPVTVESGRASHVLTRSEAKAMQEGGE